MIHPDAVIGKNTTVWHPELSNIGACQIGEGCTIHSHVWIADGVIIGNHVKIQAFAFIPSGVTIEEGAFIGPRTTFTNDRYPPSNEWSETVVKKGARIGANVTVLPGVTLGEFCLIGAGSVVTRDIPALAKVYGSPAK